MCRRNVLGTQLFTQYRLGTHVCYSDATTHVFNVNSLSVVVFIFKVPTKILCAFFIPHVC
jgi:hypothetical protein